MLPVWDVLYADPQILIRYQSLYWQWYPVHISKYVQFFFNMERTFFRSSIYVLWFAHVTSTRKCTWKIVTSSFDPFSVYFDNIQYALSSVTCFEYYMTVWQRLSVLWLFILWSSGLCQWVVLYVVTKVWNNGTDPSFKVEGSMFLRNVGDYLPVYTVPWL
jgi:hypothetical protein